MDEPVPTLPTKMPRVHYPQQRSYSNQANTTISGSYNVTNHNYFYPQQQQTVPQQSTIPVQSSGSTAEDFFLGLLFIALAALLFIAIRHLYLRDVNPTPPARTVTHTSTTHIHNYAPKAAEAVKQPVVSMEDVMKNAQTNGATSFTSYPNGGYKVTFPEAKPAAELKDEKTVH